MALKKKTQKKAPKRRNVDLQIHIERGGAGAGHHKSKGQRGGGKGSGKWGRHPKHRGSPTRNPAQLCLKPTVDPNTVDIDQLLMGIKVELEHTNDRGLAERIALHHLAEDPLYYSHLLEMERKYAPGAHSNPAVMGPKGTYDPREEQLRSMRQGMYEAGVRKMLGLPYNTPFRDRNGRRLDLKLIKAKGINSVRQTINRFMFKMGTRVPQRIGRMVSGTQVVTAKAVAEAQARFADADKALRNRQDYEETLAIARKGSFFRVVPEVTSKGLGYFVWPMYGAQKYPAGFNTKAEAATEVKRLNRDMNPLQTGKWWRPPTKKYTKRDVSHWLPPAEMFSMRGIKPVSRKAPKAPQAPKLPLKVKTAPSTIYQGTDPNGRPCWKVRGQKGYFYSEEKALKRAG